MAAFSTKTAWCPDNNMEQPSIIAFNQNVAAAYDEKTKLWAAGREALFSFMRLILAELPSLSPNGLAAGTSINVTLQFNNPNNARLRYNTSVFSGGSP